MKHIGGQKNDNDDLQKTLMEGFRTQKVIRKHRSRFSPPPLPLIKKTRSCRGDLLEEVYFDYCGD
jgi:hypothetical protein